MSGGVDWAQLIQASPWAATVLLAITSWKEARKGQKKEKEYVVSLRAISFIVASFERRKYEAERHYIRRSMEDALEFLEEFTTEMVCDFRDQIKPLIYSESFKCNLEIPCDTPKGHTLERLYLEAYEKVLSDAFRSVHKEIEQLIENNGLVHRSKIEFENYFTRRTDNIFESVIKFLKKNYDDSIMPVTLRSRLNRVNKDIITELGLSVFKRAREHREIYEDKLKTIEREELQRIEDLKKGESNGS